MPGRRLSLPIPWILLILLTISSLPAGAATFTVTKTTDTHDGSCDAADCSLREAVAAAAAGDAINFASSLNGQTIILSSFITLDKSLTLQGPGASQLAISGNNLTQIFRTDWNASAVILLDGLTLRNGATAGEGGAIFHGGSHLLIRNCVLSDNQAAGTGGGAIWNYGNLALTDTTLSRNKALSGIGGAIANYSTLAVTSSRFTDNQANDGGAINNHSGGSGQATILNSVFSGNQSTGDGGALYNYSDDTLTVHSSVLNNNSAVGGGGAIWNYSASKSMVRVENSTLSGNRADYGGGLANFGTAKVIASTVNANQALIRHGGGMQNFGTLTVLNSTVSGNAATNSTTGGDGGGIFNEAGSTTLMNSTLTGNQANQGGGIRSDSLLTLGNTLIAGNTATTEGREISVGGGAWNSQGHNLIGFSGNAGVSNSVTLASSDFTPTVALDAIIGVLADNGGPTQTHLLAAGSPAVDAGDNALIPADVTNDQRGVARVQGAQVDVGAVEGAGSSAVTTHTVIPTAGVGGTISPATPQTVTASATLTFTLTPDAGYVIQSVTGCDGVLLLTYPPRYRTEAITADCTVTARFSASAAVHTVTATAGLNGAISPSGPQSVNHGATVTFTITPATGYTAAATGCGGALNDATYTTGPITADCTVTATFRSTVLINTGGGAFSMMNHALGIVAYAAGLDTSGQLCAGSGTSSPSQVRPQAYVGRSIFPVRVRWSWRRASGFSTAATVAPLAAAETTDFIALASAANHTVALRSDGSVWSCGSNFSCQLGNNQPQYTFADEPTPVVVDSTGAPLTGVVAIAAGEDHSVAVKSDGTVWTWGHNGYGQLGDGSVSTATSCYPVQVLTGNYPNIAPLTGVKTVAASDVHTIALKTDGTIWAWGANNRGQLGLGNTAERRTAAPVLGLNDVQAITARGNLSSSRNIAQRSDGSLWGWGDNSYCQLGDPTVALGYITTPVRLANLSNLGVNVSDLASGRYHGVARQSDGNAWTWGHNSQGQLGDNTTDPRCAPILIAGVNAVETVGAGAEHTLVTRGDGSVWGWGRNDQGQLGVGDTNPRLTPTQMLGENGVSFLNLKMASGDVNGDGLVNALDVVAVINAVLGIQPLPAADVNGDGAVNALDVVFVINRVLEIPLA